MKTIYIHINIIITLLFVIIPTIMVGQTLDKTLAVGTITGAANVTPTGGAVYEIPISVPKGTNGMEPKVSIAYNSQGGNGLLGWGCNLSGISVISRVPRNVYNDGTAWGLNVAQLIDRFALDGNRLVLTSSGYYGDAGTQYHTENESSTAIVAQGNHSNNGPEWFEVDTKNGLKLSYGSQTGKILYSGTPAIDAVYSWYLDHVEDVHGNFMTYTYEQQGSAVYLKSISYGIKNVGTNLAVSTVEFAYESRTDPIYYHYLNVDGSVSQRLKTITSKTGASVFRQYTMDYTTDVFSRLIKVTESNGNNESLNPTVFTWGANNTTTFSISNPTITSNPVPFSNQGYLSSDLNGDGLSDLIGIYTQGLTTYAFVYYANKPTSGGVPSFSLGASLELGALGQVTDHVSLETSIQFGDMNGDLKNEICRIVAEVADGTCYFGFRYGGVYTPDEYTKGYGEQPLFTLADIDNNGYTDIVYLEKHPYNGYYYGKVWYSNGTSLTPIEFKLSGISDPKQLFTFDSNADGLTDLEVVTQNGIYSFANQGKIANNHFFPETPTTSYSMQIVENGVFKPGDFNGDGLVDFIYNEYKTTNWYMLLNQGNGNYNKISLPGINAKNEDTGLDKDQDNCIVYDFNQDGKSDIIIFDATYPFIYFHEFNTYWYQSTGSSLSLVKSTTSTNKGDAYSKYYSIGDFNGDGRLDLINYGYDCYNGTDMTCQWRNYSVFNNNFEGGMVTSVTDGLGNKNTFAYTSSALRTNYSEGPLGGDIGQYPEDSELHYLPSSMLLVKSLAQPTGNITSYSYKNAVAQRLRGFLGFGNTRTVQSLTGEKTYTSYGLRTHTIQGNYYVPYVVNTTDSIGNKLIQNIDYTPNFNCYPNDKRYTLTPHITTVTDYLGKKKTETQVSIDGEGIMAYSYVFNQTMDGTEQSSTKVTYLNKNQVTDNSSMRQWAPEEIVSEQTYAGDPGKTFTVTTGFEYNTNGTLLSKTDFSGTAQAVKTKYEYDDFGNTKIVTVNSSGLKSTSDTFYYDNNGRFVTKTVNALGHKMEYLNMDDWGNPHTFKDPNDLVTTYQYDNWGKLTHTITPDTTEIINSLNWGGSVTNSLYYTQTTKDGVFKGAECFDALGRSLRKETTGYNGSRFYTDALYNAKGQLASASETYYVGNQSPKKTSYNYDAYGRVYTSTLPNGTVVYYNYNDAQTVNKVTTSYSTGETFSKTYDASGLLKTATDAGGTISYSYNCMGKNTSIMAPGGTMQMKYDSYGRQDTLIDPAAGTIAYQYNAYGELVSQTDARGKITTMTYDKLGRTETQTIDGSTSHYYYDNAGAKGLLKSITNDDNKAGYLYKYDRLCRLARETRGSGADTMSFQYAYGSRGKLGKLTYPSGFAVTYNYNDNEDLISITKADNPSLKIWKLNAVNADGLLTSATYGNGTSTIYNYDSFKRLTRISVSNVLDFSYGYTGKEQLAYRSENYYNGSWQGLREDFVYDGLNRLSTVSQNNVETLRMTYKSDVNDRIETKSDIGNFIYNNLQNQQISKVTPVVGYNLSKHDLTYTAGGKLESLMETAEGKPSKYLTIQYGVDDQRFKSTYNEGGTVKYNRYYFDTYEKETNADGSLKRNLNYIYAGGSLVAIYEQKPTSDAMHYVYTDYLGSLRCITDANGAVEQRMSYDAWGNRRDPVTGNRFTVAPGNLLFARGYTGHEHLDEFGLINMNGRVYDPALGVFLSPDKYVQQPDNTQNFNRYAYGLNNPMMYTDPTGNLFWIPFAAAVLMSGFNEAINNPQMKWDWNGFAKGAIIGGATYIVTAGIAGGMGLIAPGFSNAPLAIKYLGKASYVGLTAATTATVSLLVPDIMDDGKINNKNYLSTAKLWFIIGAGTSLANSLNNYITWDRFSYEKRLDIIKNIYEQKIKDSFLDGVVFDQNKMDYGGYDQNFNVIEFGKKGLSSKPIACITMDHELIHVRDVRDGIEGALYPTAFTGKSGLTYTPFARNSEINAYLEEIYNSSSYNIPWRKIKNSIYILRNEFGFQNRLLGIGPTINNVLFNLFQ